MHHPSHINSAFHKAPTDAQGYFRDSRIGISIAPVGQITPLLHGDGLYPKSKAAMATASSLGLIPDTNSELSQQDKSGSETFSGDQLY